MARLLLGKTAADAWAEDIAGRAEALKEKGVVPKLVIVRVGEKSDDLAYERGAFKRAERVGVEAEVRVFPQSVATETLVREMQAINADRRAHGCLMFRPLPASVDERAVCAALSPEKDVDGIHPLSMARVFMNRGSGFAPCTAEAALAILNCYGIPIRGARVVVIGRSLVIGKPIAMMLVNENATVTICHTKTRDLPAVAREADILIACAGKAGMVDERFVREGQTVIDVGINVSAEGKISGDVRFDAVEPVVAAITPVPRGVGSVTATMLMRHVVEAAEAAAAGQEPRAI